MSLSNEEILRLLDDYLHGLLDDETAAEVEHRCEISPACKAALAEARGRYQSWRADRPTEAPEALIKATIGRIQRTIQDQRRWRRRIVTSMVGTLAAMVLVVL